MTDGQAQHRALPEHPLSNQGYDTFKRFVTVIYPGIITFYLALAQIWDLPYSAAIGGTLTAVGALLGILLKSFSDRYSEIEQAKQEEIATKPVEYDGDIHFVKFKGEDAHLVLHVGTQEQVESFGTRDELTFKVRVGQS